MLRLTCGKPQLSVGGPLCTVPYAQTASNGQTFSKRAEQCNSGFPRPKCHSPVYSLKQSKRCLGSAQGRIAQNNFPISQNVHFPVDSSQFVCRSSYRSRPAITLFGHACTGILFFLARTQRVCLFIVPLLFLNTLLGYTRRVVKLQPFHRRAPGRILRRHQGRET